MVNSTNKLHNVFPVRLDLDAECTLPNCPGEHSRVELLRNPMAKIKAG